MVFVISVEKDLRMSMEPVLGIFNSVFLILKMENVRPVKKVTRFPVPEVYVCWDLFEIYHFI